MPFDFDAEVARLDSIESDHFGEPFSIEGIVENVTGIFDEGFQEFEDADIAFTTVEVIASDVSSINLSGRSITRVNTGDSWLINKTIPSDSKLMLVIS